MSQGPITPKQKRVLDFIRDFTETRGYAPSQQEIAQALGVRSLGTVQNYLVRLERNGFLRRPWNAKRALELVDARAAGAEVPLLGYVAAGRPIEAVETVETLEIPSWMIRGGETFALRVRGDSMVGDGILDGDYLVVRRQRGDPGAGQVVVALIDGEATVKRFVPKGDRVELHPSNPSMSVIVVGSDQELQVSGIVVGLIRSCSQAGIRGNHALRSEQPLQS